MKKIAILTTSILLASIGLADVSGGSNTFMCDNYNINVYGGFSTNQNAHITFQPSNTYPLTGGGIIGLNLGVEALKSIATNQQIGFGTLYQQGFNPHSNAVYNDDNVPNTLNWYLTYRYYWNNGVYAFGRYGASIDADNHIAQLYTPGAYYALGVGKRFNSRWDINTGWQNYTLYQSYGLTTSNNYHTDANTISLSQWFVNIGYDF